MFPATALEGHNFQAVSFLWVARTIAVVIIPQEIAILYIAIIKMQLQLKNALGKQMCGFRKYPYTYLKDASIGFWNSTIAFKDKRQDAPFFSQTYMISRYVIV